nr:DUF2971 domain-containing protein [Desulfobacula sp.]
MYVDKLYKYLPFDGDLNEKAHQKRKIGFEKGEIWYSKSRNLNDPYDCRPVITINNKSISEIIGLLSKEETEFLRTKIKFDKIETLISKISNPQKIKYGNSIIEQYMIRHAFTSWIYYLQSSKLANIGILSLTTKNNSILMWSHYAKNHSGICIGFERNKENPLGSNRTRKVRYLKNRPKLSLLETMHEKFGKADLMLFRKSYHWKEENEWRICQPEGNKTYPYPGELSEIIFGANFPPKNMKIVKQIFGGRVKYFMAELGNDYEIIIKSVPNDVLHLDGNFATLHSRR